MGTCGWLLGILAEAAAAAAHSGVIILDQGGGFVAWMLHKIADLPVVNYMDAHKAFEHWPRVLVVVDRCRPTKDDELAGIVHLGAIAPPGCILIPLKQYDDTDKDVMHVCGLNTHTVRDYKGKKQMYRYEASQTHTNLENPWYLQWDKDGSFIRAETLQIAKCAVTHCTRTTWCHPLCAQHTQEVFGVRLGHSTTLGCVGLFATRLFDTHDLIVPYMGQVERIHHTKDGQRAHSAYVIRPTTKHQNIDGAVIRGLGAMANHSSKTHANAVQKSGNTNRFPRDVQEATKHAVWLRAKREIKPGEEILLYYGEQHKDINSTEHETVDWPHKLGTESVVEAFEGDRLLFSINHKGEGELQKNN